jgi:hypothetical protein
MSSCRGIVRYCSVGGYRANGMLERPYFSFRSTLHACTRTWIIARGKGGL